MPPGVALDSRRSTGESCLSRYGKSLRCSADVSDRASISRPCRRTQHERAAVRLYLQHSSKIETAPSARVSALGQSNISSQAALSQKSAASGFTGGRLPCGCFGRARTRPRHKPSPPPEKRDRALGIQLQGIEDVDDGFQVFPERHRAAKQYGEVRVAVRIGCAAGLRSAVVPASASNAAPALDKPSPRLEYASTIGGNAIGEAAWQTRVLDVHGCATGRSHER